MKAWWLRVIRPEPKADKRPFIVRLLTSMRPKISKDKNGWTFWMTGGADF